MGAFPLVCESSLELGSRGDDTAGAEAFCDAAKSLLISVESKPNVSPSARLDHVKGLAKPSKLRERRRSEWVRVILGEGDVVGDCRTVWLRCGVGLEGEARLLCLLGDLLGVDGELPIRSNAESKLKSKSRSGSESRCKDRDIERDSSTEGVVLVVLGRVVETDEAGETEVAEETSLTATVDSTDSAASGTATGAKSEPLDSSKKEARSGLRYGREETGSASASVESCGFGLTV